MHIVDDYFDSLFITTDKKKSAENIQKAVKLLIISLILLDGIIVSGIRAIYWPLIVWILLVPAFIISKKFYIT